MSANPIRYGAFPEDWNRFESLAPLLPVVSNSDAPTSPQSKISAAHRGKVPSAFNRQRQVVGISEWTGKKLSPKMIEELKTDPDIGICVVTGHGMIAIDCDVTDPNLASEIKAAIERLIGKPLSVRHRANSTKFLVPLRITGAITKQTIKTRAGCIELLGRGQQFVAAGTHPSGARIEWYWPESEIPQITQEQLTELWDALAKRFGTAPATVPSAAPASTVKVDQVPTVDPAQVASRVQEVRDLLVNIKLPEDAQQCYDQWRDVGMAVHHHTGGSEEGCQAWFDWSATQPGVEQGEDLWSVCHDKWASFGRRKNGAAPLTIAKLRQMQPMTADAFEAVPQEDQQPAANDTPAEQQPAAQQSATGNSAQPASTTAARFRRAERLSEMKPKPALWENAIPQGSIFAIGALPGRSKSYGATGLAYALAADRGEFLGRALPTGYAAVYVDVERLATTLLRISTWADADGIDPTKLPLHVTGNFVLNDPTSVQNLIDALRDLEQTGGRKIGLVIIDSLGASVYGTELNSSGPASLAGKMLRDIRDAIGCTVGVVAHSPKSGDETVAGSMQFDAIFDSALFMRSENEGATGCLYMKKDNGLALEEHERFIGWQRETVVRSAGDRPVRVHRLVTGDAQGSTGGDQKPKPAAKQPTLPERARVVLADLTLGGQQSATYDQWVAELAKYSQGATVKDRRDVAVRAIRAVLNAGHARIEDNNTARLL